MWVYMHGCIDVRFMQECSCSPSWLCCHAAATVLYFCFLQVSWTDCLGTLFATEVNLLVSRCPLHFWRRFVCDLDRCIIITLVLFSGVSYWYLFPFFFLCCAVQGSFSECVGKLFPVRFLSCCVLGAIQTAASFWPGCPVWLSLLGLYTVACSASL